MSKKTGLIIGGVLLGLLGIGTGAYLFNKSREQDAIEQDDFDEENDIQDIDDI